MEAMKEIKVNKIREPMNREDLDKIVENLKSDDDYVNYHLKNIEETPKNKFIIILSDEEPKNNKNIYNEEPSSVLYLTPEAAYDNINNYLDEGKASAKPKEVMRNGYNKTSQDAYYSLVEQEKEESKYVKEFTQPTFEEMYDNIYVNTFNGDTYNMKDEDIAVELRDNVGVIIPGLIDNQEEYFEFVRRLKDKGKNGLGRTIYEKYEDYQEALELISTYINAVYDKYGGKEEFYNAKDMGGLFGGYEYIPEIKPRFKKTLRNLKLDAGLPPVEYKIPENLGYRILKDGEKEFGNLDNDIDNDFEIYEETPPKFRDLPDDIKLLYENDRNGNNGIQMIRNFKTYEQYAEDLIRSQKPENMREGQRILQDIENKKIMESDIYESMFPDSFNGDYDDLKTDQVIRQFDYDKMVYEHGEEFADRNYDTSAAEKAYKEIIKQAITVMNGWESEKDNIVYEQEIEDSADYAVKYMYDLRFRNLEDEKHKTAMKAAEDIYTVNGKTIFGENNRHRVKKGDSAIELYIEELSANVQDTIEYMESNAETGEYRSTSDVVGYKEYNNIDSDFNIDPEPEAIYKYAIRDRNLAKRIYELSGGEDENDMFSPRTNINDFIEQASTPCNPVITNDLIHEVKWNQRLRKGGMVEHDEENEDN